MLDDCGLPPGRHPGRNAAVRRARSGTLLRCWLAAKGMVMTTDTRTWTIRYEYDPKARAWSAVSDSPRVASWGRTLARAQASVREAIELHLDLPDGRSLDGVGVVVQD